MNATCTDDHCPERVTLEVIKDEDRTRIEICREGGRKVVRKRYSTPLHLRWRTFFMPSRALREYRGLALLARRGLDGTRPVGFEERRGAWGQVLTSTLITAYEEGAEPLRELLRRTDPARGEDRALRREAGRQFGLYLRRLHRAGVLHGRASTKDFLLAGYPEATRVFTCDVPYAAFFAGGILGRRRADVDLFHALFQASRRAEMSRAERWRILLAYTGGDRSLARRIWRRQARRTRWWNDCCKISLIVWDQYIFMTLRKVTGRWDFPMPAGSGPVAGKSKEDS